MSSSSHMIAAGSARALPPLSRVLIRVALVVAEWDNRRRTRHSLAQLDPHMIRDIGLDPLVAEIEAAKPFWRG